MTYSCAKMLPSASFSFSATALHHPHAFPSYSGPSFPYKTPPPPHSQAHTPPPFRLAFPIFPPSRRQKKDKRPLRNHHLHHCCRIAIRFRVDIWCPCPLPSLFYPHVAEKCNGIFIARGHNKAHHLWHWRASHSFTTRVSWTSSRSYPQRRHYWIPSKK